MKHHRPTLPPAPLTDPLNRVIVASAMRCGSTTVVQAIRELAGGLGRTRCAFIQPHGATAEETLACMGTALASFQQKNPGQRVLFKSHTLTAGQAARWLSKTDLRLVVPWRPLIPSMISRILYMRRRETTDLLGAKSEPYSEAQQFCQRYAPLDDEAFVNNFIRECPLVLTYAADWLRHHVWFPEDHPQVFMLPIDCFKDSDIAEALAEFIGLSPDRVEAAQAMFKLENSIASQPPGHIAPVPGLKLDAANLKFLAHLDAINLDAHEARCDAEMRSFDAEMRAKDPA